ncbi:MAG: hypothetical protein J3R72DRAFT_512328 [Linnemannia gamsii]|nr:MAG: hypothetical protein J3R72DRAFT_512328 [Linnemannia gamsii]
MDSSASHLFYPSTWDPLTTTNTNMDLFEQYLDPSSVHSLLDFEQWPQSQANAFIPPDVAPRASQDQPSLSTTFANLSLSDPLDMPQGLTTSSMSRPLQQSPRLQLPLPSPTSLLSSSVYEDAYGLSWPTSDVSFHDFDMQDLSFLDVPFSISSTVTTPTTTSAPLFDYQSQLGDDTNAMNDLSYSVAPAAETTTPVSSMLSNLLSPITPATQHLPHFIPVSEGTTSNTSVVVVNPFRSMAKVSNLFLPQMDNSLPPLQLPPALVETAPANLLLLWSAFPTAIPPTHDSLPFPTLAPVPAPVTSSSMVLPAMTAIPKSTPVQDKIICQAYSPNAFVLDGSMIAKRAVVVAASRQAPISFKAGAPYRRTSVSVPDAAGGGGGGGGGVHRTPYTRSRYSQNLKKRPTPNRSDDGNRESDSDDECLKLHRTTELMGITTPPKHLASLQHHEQSFLTPLLSSPSYIHQDSIQRPPSPSSSEQKPNSKGKGKGKGRRPTLKKITDCAHYRPRNAFFMFRGFVSHIHTYLHAKQLSASSSSSPTHFSASCSMTSTPTLIQRPDATENRFNCNSGDSTTITTSTSSPNFLSFSIPSDTHQPHLSLSFSLPPTATTTAQSYSFPPPSTSISRRRRQAQTKVSVSCGKIWSSPCFPTCRPGLGLGHTNATITTSGCANCRMRSLFRQASDYLKLRQTEIERLIEFPLLSQEYECEDASEPMPKMTTTTVMTMTMMRGRRMLTRLEDSFNWKEFEGLYHRSDLFKWHRDYYTNDNIDNDNENDNEVRLDIEEMKAIWMENELAYEKAFSEGARKRIAQEGLKATTGIANSSSSNKRTATLHH